MSIISSARAEIDYPSSDGKPMAESDLHRDWMFVIIDRLKRFFQGQRVYVSGNLLFYYIEGDPKKSFAPDAFVVKDCDPRRRETYKLWEEAKGPDFVIETTSRTTRRQDLGPKMRLYTTLRVPEYFLYDPRGDWLRPPLCGYRLVGDAYVRLEPEEQGGLASEQLGITFRLEAGQLVMLETATGEKVLSNAEYAEEQRQRAQLEAERAKEAQHRAAKAEQQLARETAARKALELKIARLRRKNK